MSRLVDSVLESRKTAAGHDDLDESPSFIEARSLKRALLAELRASHEENSPVRPEDILDRWPADPQTDPDVASLLFEDFKLRQEKGEEPSIDDYDRRFPQQKDSLAGLLRNHNMLRSLGRASNRSVPRLVLPSVGEELFGYRLKQELGRGAFARVFLAEQSSLAGRPVVLKVSNIEGNEPQTLAQLQHTHIVPIYSVHEQPDAGLRAVCMPFFGGASLSRILQELWQQTRLPTRGDQFVAALNFFSNMVSTRDQEATPADQQSSTENRTLKVENRLLVALADMTYLEATAWTVARLAEGLQHAHDRGVLHRDIKPSNILISSDGEPMLLDFNLAQNVNTDPEQATLGGTIAYMSPEHLRALATRDPALARQVDHRSDVYSLGMVLYEMLAGESPFDQSASYTPLPALIEAMAVERGKVVPSLRTSRPDAPWSLESIVRKCLAADPRERYQKAEHLAEDLTCFLEDQPLKHAPEPSRVERLRKWIRRHPRLASSGAVAAAAGILIVIFLAALVGVRKHLAITHSQLEEKRALQLMREYRQGTDHALFLINTNTDGDDQRSAESAQGTDIYHSPLTAGIAVCEKTLGLYGVLDRDDWQQGRYWQLLGEKDRLALAEDTRELLLLLAWARARVSSRSQESGASSNRASKLPTDHLQQSLQLLDRAEVIEGLPPSRALWLERAAYLEQLGDSAAAQAARERAAGISLATAHDHYLLAGALTRQHQLDQAMTHLNHALQLNPRHYWSWVQRGIVHLERGELELAAGDFGVSIGMWPEFAWGYFNRGCAYYRSGRKLQAISDYSAALDRDPQFLQAYWNRGLARQELEQYEQSLEDFDRAASLGRDDAFLHAYRGTALERLGRTREADAAFRIAFVRALASPREVRQGVRWCYGFAISRRLPEEAREAFEDVLRENPKHPQALYGLAMLAVDAGKLPEAINYFTRAIDASSRFTEARRYRAILQARLGKFDEAEKDIDWLLERHPQDPAALHAAACVYALAAKQFPEPLKSKATADAVNLLREAFAHGYDRVKAARDPDLESIREQKAYTHLFPQNAK